MTARVRDADRDDFSDGGLHDSDEELLRALATDRNRLLKSLGGGLPAAPSPAPVQADVGDGALPPAAEEVERRRTLSSRLPDPIAAWLPELIGRDVSDMAFDDLEDGFALVQAVSVLSPASVDLTWYTTDGALSCPDLRAVNLKNLRSGLARAGVPVPADVIDTFEAGDVGAACAIATALMEWAAGRETSRVDRIRSGGVARPERASRKSARVREAVEPMVEVLPSAEHIALTTTVGADDDMEPEYEPAEPAFKTGLRWLLGVILESANPQIISDQARNEVIQMLESIKDAGGVIPAGPILPALACGALYELASRSILPADGENGTELSSPRVESLTAPGPEPGWVDREGGFLDRLIADGLLEFRANLRDSVSAMISDRSPLYESVHSNIMDALMEASSQQLSVRDVLAFLSKHFPTINSRPFDLEDALLLWVNASSRLMDSTWSDLDDLSHSNLRDGRAVALACAAHGLPLDPSRVHPRRDGKEVDRARRDANWCAVETAVVGFVTPPWRPAEAAGDGSFGPALLVFLTDLFRAVRGVDHIGVPLKRVVVSRKSVREVAPGSSKSSRSSKKSASTRDPSGPFATRDTAERETAAHKTPDDLNPVVDAQIASAIFVAEMPTIAELEKSAVSSVENQLKNTSAQPSLKPARVKAKAPSKSKKRNDAAKPNSQRMEPKEKEPLETLEVESRMEVVPSGSTDVAHLLEETVSAFPTGTGEQLSAKASPSSEPQLDGVNATEPSFIQELMYAPLGLNNAALNSDFATAVPTSQSARDRRRKLRSSATTQPPKIDAIAPPEVVNLQNASSVSEASERFLPPIVTGTTPTAPKSIHSVETVHLPLLSELSRRKPQSREVKTDRSTKTAFASSVAAASQPALSSLPIGKKIATAPKKDTTSDRHTFAASGHFEPNSSDDEGGLTPPVVARSNDGTDAEDEVVDPLITSALMLDTAEHKRASSTFSITRTEAPVYRIASSTSSSRTELDDAPPKLDVDMALYHGSDSEAEADAIIAEARKELLKGFGKEIGGRSRLVGTKGRRSKRSAVRRKIRVALTSSSDDECSNRENDSGEDIKLVIVQETRRSAKEEPVERVDPITYLNTIEGERDVAEPKEIRVQVTPVTQTTNQKAHSNVLTNDPSEVPPTQREMKKRRRLATGFYDFPIPEHSENESSENESCKEDPSESTGEPSSKARSIISQQSTTSERRERGSELAWERSQIRAEQLRRKHFATLQSNQRRSPKDSRQNESFKNEISTNGVRSKSTLVRLEEERRQRIEGRRADQDADRDNARRRNEEDRKQLLSSRASERASRKRGESSPTFTMPVSDVVSGNLLAGHDGVLRTRSTSLSPRKRLLPYKKGPESNRVLIRNALLHVCLAGTVNENVKHDVLDDLENCKGSHFIILFRGANNHAFRGLYSYDPILQQVLKVYSPAVKPPEDSSGLSLPKTPPYSASMVPNTGPDSITEGDVVEFYKYDSGSRTFKLLPTRSFGRSVHAVALRSDFWRSYKWIPQ